MTSYQEILDSFYSRIEKDASFFLYVKRKPDESMAIARKRAMAYMKMACAEINLTCHPRVNFSNRNDKMAMFLFDLTDVERDIPVFTSVGNQADPHTCLPYHS